MRPALNFYKVFGCKLTSSLGGIQMIRLFLLCLNAQPTPIIAFPHWRAKGMPMPFQALRPPRAGHLPCNSHQGLPA